MDRQGLNLEISDSYEKEVVKKVKLTQANIETLAKERKNEIQLIMQSDPQKIFNTYAHLVNNDDKKFKNPTFQFLSQTTTQFLRRMEEHRQILKNLLDSQIRISQNNAQLLKAFHSYTFYDIPK